jgi:hypothetical protein
LLSIDYGILIIILNFFSNLNLINLLIIIIKDVHAEQIDQDRPQSFDNNFIHHMAIGENMIMNMWQLNAAAISIEKLLDNILKEIKNENSEKIQFSFNGKCENISYNMSYLTTICHPLIIIRMLQHRLFVPFTRRNNVNPTRATAASTVTSNSLSIFSHNNKSNIFAIIIIIITV